ncbi:ribokinase [Streptomyces sp. NBC_01190]|uniref:ribokinase n=1 Tax=Streptomyces sp. NBC_01190 TaxID=2903767 RepID=UPI00386E39F3|nr:ribokinase [Streptomyces sp. NBC_01190]
MTDIAVVGSANLDLVAHAPRRPEPGETVLGTGFEQHPGGKGLNQAVAAAGRAATAFVGHCGDDDAAAVLRDALRGRGVDTAHFTAVPGASGRALISVTPDGENSITVLPGANTRLTAADVTAALDALAPAIVLAQQEVPAAALGAAAEWADRRGARFVLNASPSVPPDERVLAGADPLLVNRGEAAYLTGVDHPPAAARALAGRCRSAVITLGADGCLIAVGDRITPLPAPRTTAVDTTGAGDVFAGVLVAHLAQGVALTDAAARATQAAADAIRTPRASR